jgi:hypothetical protein
MTYQGINPSGEEPFTAQNKPSRTRSQPDLNLAADGFDLWWEKTFAQHTAVVAQASALMRAHRRVSSAVETRIGQTP